MANNAEALSFRLHSKLNAMSRSLLAFFLLSCTLAAKAQPQNALDFDGIDDKVTIPAASSLIANSNGISLACWVYPRNTAPGFPNFDGIAGFRNESDCDFYMLQLTATSVEARFRNSAFEVYTVEGFGLQLNTWQLLVLTYDGSTLSFYINGALSASTAASGTITNTSADMLIGDLQGRLHYYRNEPQGSVAQFVLDDPTVTALVAGSTVLMDVGQFATPQLVDMDDDGQLDLLIGERNGNINYYRNLGNIPEPRWELVNDSVGGVLVDEWWNVTGYSVPFMFRNNDNQRELVVGSESGWIHHYDQIDGNLNGTWHQVDSTWQDLREGARSAVALYDFNDDGYKDAVIGNYRGGISYWRNDFGMSLHTLDGLSADQAFVLAPNPAAANCTVRLTIPMLKNLHLDVLNDLGQTVLSSPMQDRTLEVGTDHLQAGVYMVRLSDTTHRWTQRLAIVR